MDPRYCAQDVLRCHLCETAVPPLYCDHCNINLCKACVGEHLLDESGEHKIVPIKQKWNPTPIYPKCLEHFEKQCELHCEQCGIPICSLCVSSKDHKNHDIIDILKYFETAKGFLVKDLQELEKSIYTKYAGIASSIEVQKDTLKKKSQTLKAIINKQGEFWHRELDNIIKNLQSDIDDMECNQLGVLDKEEDKINIRINEISLAITDIRKILDSYDVCRFSEYAFKSRIAEFRELPPQLELSLPNFFPGRIDPEHLQEQFGCLTKINMAKVARTYTLDFPSEKFLLDEPQITTNINTDYYQLYDVTRLRDEEIWTSGSDDIINLYNVNGELLKSVQTTSGNMPSNIQVTESGHLMYTDYNDRSVCIVRNEQIERLISLEKWRPHSVCNIHTGDLLVIMTSDNVMETKIVRFSGSTEKQIIQWDNKHHPLFSSDGCKYLSENRNFDICVVDGGAHAVVVVNASGKLRFRYTGHLSATKGWFCPVGITTDSLGRILTTDSDNDCIHILDQDGQFLRYIDNCNFQAPQGLFVDSNDNLFVADSKSGIVKKIQYYK